MTWQAQTQRECSDTYSFYWEKHCLTSLNAERKLIAWFCASLWRHTSTSLTSWQWTNTGGDLILTCGQHRKAFDLQKAKTDIPCSNKSQETALVSDNFGGRSQSWNLKLKKDHSKKCKCLDHSQHIRLSNGLNTKRGKRLADNEGRIMTEKDAFESLEFPEINSDFKSIHCKERLEYQLRRITCPCGYTGVTQTIQNVHHLQWLRPNNVSFHGRERTPILEPFVCLETELAGAVRIFGVIWASWISKVTAKNNCTNRWSECWVPTQWNTLQLSRTRQNVQTKASLSSPTAQIQ